MKKYTIDGTFLSIIVYFYIRGNLPRGNLPYEIRTNRISKRSPWKLASKPSFRSKWLR